MKWYADLYVSDSCRAQKESIRNDIEQGLYSHKLFLITLAVNQRDLLEIRRASSLSRESLRRDLPMIIGAAGSKEDAIQLSCRIVEECYRSRKDVNVREYLSP